VIVSRESIRGFAALTGDDAPIHADPAFARAAGFSAPIAQGLLVASFAERAFAQAAGGAPPNGFEVRFQQPVVTGDSLRLRAHGDEFEVESQQGVVVARGRAGELEARVAPPERGAETQMGRDRRRTASPQPWYAEDVMERFAPGTRVLPAISREMAARFDALFPPQREVSPTVSGALLFATGFARFLTALLACPLPEAGSAGHLGDRWRVRRAPVFDEALRVDYHAASLARSRSRPTMAIVEFAIDIRAEAGLLVDGTAALWIPLRPAETGISG